MSVLNKITEMKYLALIPYVGDDFSRNNLCFVSFYDYRDHFETIKAAFIADKIDFENDPNHRFFCPMNCAYCLFQNYIKESFPDPRIPHIWFIPTKFQPARPPDINSEILRIWDIRNPNERKNLLLPNLDDIEIIELNEKINNREY